MTEDELAELAVEQFQALALQRHQQAAVAQTGVETMLCEDCGNVIPAARRKALPGVALCIDCKRKEELEEKRYG